MEGSLMEDSPVWRGFLLREGFLLWKYVPL